MSAGFTIFLFGASGILAVFFWAVFRDRVQYKVPKEFPIAWIELLNKHVHFYQNLDQAGKEKFQSKVRNFLKQVRITGIQLEVTDLDRLLTASSAIIPLFNFPTWRFHHLHEVLLYPSHFDSNFSIDDPQEVITGMVGSGRNMDGVMILNRDSLHEGFRNTKDKKNVGIHEFVHLLDKEDGAIDGIPLVLNQKDLKAKWMKLMHLEMERIKQGESDIDEYAATGDQEFLAVSSEYFFERPKLFKSKHPKLYQMLEKVYQIDMISRLKKSFKPKKRVGRNDPCPCGSGKKFKFCCLK